MVKIKIFEEKEEDPERVVYLKLESGHPDYINLIVVDKYGNKIGDELLYIDTVKGKFRRMPLGGDDLTDLEKCGFKFNSNKEIQEMEG